MVTLLHVGVFHPVVDFCLPPLEVSLCLKILLAASRRADPLHEVEDARKT